MRLVLVVFDFPQRTETYIVNKFLGLLARGVDVHIACRRSDPAAWAQFPGLADRPELRRRVHDQPTRRQPRKFARALLSGLALEASRRPRGGRVRAPVDAALRLVADAQLAALHPDLLHYEFGFDAADRMHVADLLDCPVTVSFRGRDLNSVGLEHPGYYDQVWRRCAAAHFLGEDLHRRAQQRGCPPDLAHALIPPAIDAQFFVPEPRSGAQVGTPERPLRLLSVGRLRWKKGYEYALEAVAKLRARGLAIEYRIVGDGKDEASVRACIEDYDLGDCVELLGHRPRGGVRDELQWADIFLHAAVSEGFCNAAMEAQAMQVPVVCSDADGLPENVVDAATGFVVPRRDAQALADRVAVLAADPELRGVMGKAGRERVVARFDLAGHLEAWHRFYDEVVGVPA